uniref:uncharacterized protein LOC109966921 n=1 Tax=Monopterus albus TaxID=43700 RepID=UPI0009B3A10C|nr:uncharacterized protein LOC109966921 [Monopterus albus]
MGSDWSQEDYDRVSLVAYEDSLQQPGLFPDVGIDESLLKYSGLNSAAALQSYFDELIDNVPGYFEKLVSVFGELTSVPHAVGLGALVISTILDICIKSTRQSSVDSYSMLRRVFGEEKASAVRDTMSEYLKRHRIYINNEQRLLKDLRTLELQLSGHLTTLRNSLLYDGQMSSRGFKIWVNGASFHVQMLIHEARLKTQAGERESDYVSISNAIDVYVQDLDELLEKYKTYRTSTTKTGGRAGIPMYGIERECHLQNTETGCEYKLRQTDFCCYGIVGFSDEQPNMIKAYVNHVFSKYEPIASLRSHFSNIKNNLNSLINQHDSFTLPPRT